MLRASLTVSARSSRSKAVALALSALGLLAPLFASTQTSAQTIPGYDCRSMDPTKWPPSSKPYFLLAVDTSSSMLSCTNPATDYESGNNDRSCPAGAALNSCGWEPTRLNDAKCAMQKTIKAFAGEVDFGLMTYGTKLSGCDGGPVTDSCPGTGANHGSTNGSCTAPTPGGFSNGFFTLRGEYYDGNGCTITKVPGPDNGHGLGTCGSLPNCTLGARTLSPIFTGGTVNGATLPGRGWRDGGNVVVDLPMDSPGVNPASNVNQLLSWFDGSTAGNTELYAFGYTPLEGILRSAHQYYAAGWSSAWTTQNYCASTIAGAAAIDHATPIVATGANADLPCRSLNVLLVTDGQEECNGNPQDAAADMYTAGTVIQGVRKHIKTYVIGFNGGVAGGVNSIADAGDDGNGGNGTATAYIATDEVQLSQALSDILSKSISPETCDNQDNNCNGCIDEGSKLYCDRNKTGEPLVFLQNAANKPDVSMCCNDTRASCLAAYSASITSTNPKGSQYFLPCWDPATSAADPTASWVCSDPGEVCDEKDNNCDVDVIKGAADFSTNTVDEQQNKCGSPTKHCPEPETCNGQDDNCDQITDNDTSTSPVSSKPYSACPATCASITQETCNGCDDDCNGIIDDNVADQPCGFSPPAQCAGVRKCTEHPGVPPGSCLPGVTPPGTNEYGACNNSPAGSDTTCDSIDDNCNGLVDEGALPVACTNGQPGLVYTDTEPASQCVKGQQACHSTSCVGWVGPSKEVCDGIDNDCDGIVDNNLGGTVGNACGSTVGICTKGITACVGGVIVCGGSAKTPQPEVCNGLDDNCNGQTDEAPLNDGPAAPGCWQNPGNACQLVGAVNTVQWSPPTGANCADDGTLSSPCQPGALVCTGSTGWVCQGGTGPSPEICDGADNDCNGKTDTADPGITGTGGVCAPPGTKLGTACQGTVSCSAGKLSCTGGSSPTPEICDGLDNDCDGLVDAADPDLQGMGGVCGSSKGLCKPGTLACVGGAPVCQGGVKPNPEICDGLDNDCDGSVDDTPTDTPADLGCWNIPGTQCTGGGTTWNRPANGTCTGLGTLTSPCSAGTLVCSGTNKWVCQGGTIPGNEVCDGADNDCNGTADDGNPGGGGPCGTAPNAGTCKKGTLTCSAGQLSCVGEIGPSQELCDGLDNDCNGTPDDNITSGVGNACGSSTGICKKGVTACVNGSIQCAGGTSKSIEVCNGLDDDCDGTVDNNLSDGPANPGCWQTPGTTCSFKNVKWSAPPGATCQDVGTLKTPCTTGALLCGGTSGWFCQGGLPPSAELCDDKDNNCDGNIDEGNPGGGVSCGSNVGACKPGTLTCTSGGLTCSGGTSPSPEICDGIDNNCDGQIDEPANLVGLGQICGSNIGTCKAGVMTCDAVTHQPVCQGEVKPSPEICDGLDNDCNGSIDDRPTDTPSDPGCWQNPGSSCSFGTLKWDPPAGATCTTTGGLSSPCTPGGLVCKNGGWECSGGRVPEASEVCDGVDNDCNGTVDDNNPGGGASCGKSNVGECKYGTIECVGGSLSCVGEIAPTPEICDNKDNDCNGTVDDNAPGSGAPCTGQCSTGKTACVGGALICNATKQPTPEVCNGLDDDCNGLVDDGLLADAPGAGEDGCWNVAGTACTFGAAPGAVTKWAVPPGATCSGLGTLTAPCQTGRLRCDGVKGWSCIGGTVPATEICDGKDQNCDGQIDDGDPGGGASCGINVGTCTYGTQHCQDGVLTCSGQGKTPEKCNGLDDDCDGVVDNGLPLGKSCTPDYDTAAYPGDRSRGQCRPGVLECDPSGSGKFLCKGGTAPSPEICDGVDNDCDGKVDEPGQSPDGLNGSVDPTDTSATPRKLGDLCGSSVGECKQGTLGCVGGQVQCRNDVRPQPEICDCLDNDCNGKVDDSPTGGSAPGLCGADTACVKDGNSCECAKKCLSGEFPCPTGFECKDVKLSSDTTESLRSCVSAACADCESQTVTTNNVTECGPAGTVDAKGRALPLCECAGGTACHSPCFTTSCDSGSACVTSGDFVGRCEPMTDCRFFGCGAGKACNNGVCLPNPCDAQPGPCPADQVCRPSATFDRAICEPSCASVTCQANETCVAGVCKPTGCALGCPSGQVCRLGAGDAGSSCVADPCLPKDGNPPCNDGSFCDPSTGQCGQDPCEGVLCPANQVCRAGQCETAPTQTGGGGNGNGGSGVGGSGNGGNGTFGGASGQGAGTGLDASLGGATNGGGVTGSNGNAGTGQEKSGLTSQNPNAVIGLATGGGGCRCDLTARGSSNRGALALAGLLVAALATRRRSREEGGAP